MSDPSELVESHARDARPSNGGRKGGRTKLNAGYRILRDRICFFEYPPGTILRESELASEFETSRTPIRQILQRLEIEGLVEVRDGVGTLVTPVDYAALSDVYRLRLKVAELIGDLNPRPLSRELLSQLTALLTEARTLSVKPNLRGFWRIENDRHNIINLTIGNVALSELHDKLYFQTARVWYGVVDRMWPEAIDGLCRELEQLRRCGEISDLRGFGLAYRNMIAEGMIRLEHHFSEAEAKAGY